MGDTLKRNTERGALIDMRDVGIADKGQHVIVTDNTDAHAVPFAGFIVGNNGAEISAITAVNLTNDITGTNFPLTPGQFYPIEGTSITLTSGAMLLILKGTEA